VSEKAAGVPILFYDGGCGLCHRAVRLLLRLDGGARLRFAPIGGETFEAVVPETARATLPDSLVLSTGDGRLLVRSAAVLGALRSTGRAGEAAAAVTRLVPRAVADWLYDRVAGARKRVFGTPAEACPAPPALGRGRLLP
jgi:predicted DCC family thiol-disulfide oxidoreductase YuxK